MRKNFLSNQIKVLMKVYQKNLKHYILMKILHLVSFLKNIRFINIFLFSIESTNESQFSFKNSTIKNESFLLNDDFRKICSKVSRIKKKTGEKSSISVLNLINDVNQINSNNTIKKESQLRSCNMDKCVIF